MIGQLRGRSCKESEVVIEPAFLFSAVCMLCRHGLVKISFSVSQWF